MIGNATVTLTLQINAIHLGNIEGYVGKLTSHVPEFCHQEVDPGPGVAIAVEHVNFEPSRSPEETTAIWAASSRERPV